MAKSLNALNQFAVLKNAAFSRSATLLVLESILKLFMSHGLMKENWFLYSEFRCIKLRCRKELSLGDKEVHLVSYSNLQLVGEWEYSAKHELEPFIEQISKPQSKESLGLRLLLYITLLSFKFVYGHVISCCLS